MRLPIVCYALILLLPLDAAAQQPDRGPWRGSTAPAGTGQARPDQPVQLHEPTLQRVQPQRPDEARTPFQLSPQQQAQVDWVLQQWERRSAATKTFRANFTRFEYDPHVASMKNHVASMKNFDPNKPVYTDQGEVRYEAPDKGLFAVLDPEERRQRWVCDGESVYEYQYEMEPKTLVEYPLPEEMRGRAIANGPLPFVFGSTAESLKHRYWMRLTTPPEVKGEIWLEAFPKHQQDRANFRRVEIILEGRQLQPKAIRIELPNGDTRHTYVFTDIKVNEMFGFLQGDPFRATTPIGWKKIVERPQPSQVSRPGAQPRR